MKCRSCLSPLKFEKKSASAFLEKDDVKITRSSKKSIQLTECLTCGLVQINSLEDSNLVTDFYRELEDVSYDSQDIWRKKSFDYDLNTVIKTIASTPQKIVEIGAFTGLGAEVINKNFPNSYYLGIEPSLWAVQQAQKKGFNVVAKALEDHIPENDFQLAVSWAVIEHLEDPNIFFDQLNKVVAPNAFLFLNFPDWDSWWRRLLGRNWWFVETKHRTYFNKRTISNLAARHGWVYVDSWPQKKSRSFNYLVERVLDRFGLKIPAQVLPKMEVNYYPGQLGVIFKKRSESRI